jgi:predicted Zn-dependent protease
LSKPATRDNYVEAINLFERALVLDPRSVDARSWLATALEARIDSQMTAIPWFEKARSANPRFAFVRGRLAAAYALKGETDRAVAELAEARRLSGDGRFASIASLKAARSWGVPKIRALFETTLFAGLRKAGMPEE